MYHSNYGRCAQKLLSLRMSIINSRGLKYLLCVCVYACVHMHATVCKYKAEL